MRHIGTLALMALITFAITTAALSEGILRVPNANGDDRFMPLRGVFVDIDVHDQVAITTVRDRFFIPGDEAVDAYFHFKLPAEASVTGIGYWRDEEFIEFALRPGEQGGSGGGAHDNSALENYLGHNPFNIFLDSIPAGILEVQLQYAELLPYDFGVVSLTYPIFTPNDFLMGEIDTVALDMRVSSQRQMTTVECAGPLHDDTMVRLENRNLARARFFHNDYRPDGDWLLQITFNQEDIGGWIYTHRSDTTADGYFLLVVEPGIVDEDEQVRKFFTFLIDRSGSMAGAKMVQAKAAAISCLGGVSRTDTFNVVSFSSSVHAFSQRMLPGTPANITGARNYVNGLNANGSTNIYEALRFAVNQNMGEGTANQIVFMTDGLPTGGIVDPDVIVEIITQQNVHDARIFTFGIGQDVDTSMLASLAQNNRGRSFLIDPEGARIDSVVANFYRYIATPALVNPEVEFAEGLEVDSLAPDVLQDLSAGRQLFLFGRYGSYGSYGLSLNGRMANGDTSFVFENLDFPELTEENQFIPRMWAKATIDYWLEWMAAHGQNQRIIDKIIELSLRFGILTPYTEYEQPPDDTSTAVTDPAIALIRVKVITGGREVSWSVDGVNAVATFNLYRSLDGAEFVRLNDTPLLENRFLDTQHHKASSIRYRVEMLIDGKSIWSAIFEAGQMPSIITLAEPFPNPFNATTSISYFLPKAGEVNLTLIDLTGAEVKTLVNGSVSAGGHSFVLRAEELPAGIYMLKLQSDGAIATRKLVLVK
jgi:Ca-activated chloride channel family protein